ncbi:MAG: hypothetical protein WCT85_04890 [Parachlamydiales bacterium]
MKKNIIFILTVLSFPIIAFTEENVKENDEIVTEQSASENAETSTKDLQENPENAQVASNEETSSEVALNIPEINNLQNNPLEETRAPATFPIQTTLGYNFDGADSIGKYFLMAEATDVLNKDKDRKINFLIKVPYFQQTEEVNKFQASVEKFSLNFMDPSLDVTLGDSKYDLSPLTIKSYEKRGALLKLKQESFDFNALYLLGKTENKDLEKSENMASTVCIKPSDFINLYANYVYSKFEEPSTISDKKNNHVYSLRATINPNKALNLDIESAIANSLDVKSAFISTLNLKSADPKAKRNYAHFANMDGKIDNFSYKLALLHLNPLFVCDLYDKDNKLVSDRSKIDGFIKFEKNNFGVKLSDFYERKNLENSLKKGKAKRDNNMQLSFNYPIFSLKNSLGINRREMKVLTKHDGYKLDSVSLSSSYPIKKFSLENGLELGLYKSRAENYKGRNWRNYKLTFNYNPSTSNSFSIYTKLGNLIYEEIFTDSIALGAAFKIRANNNFGMSFAYEFSDNTRKATPFPKSKSVNWKGNYFKQDFTYTLSNNHKIAISSHLNKPLSEDKETEVLITYSIPFEVPNINRAINRIRSAF